jgi:excisionase family DNA binding protein
MDGKTLERCFQAPLMKPEEVCRLLKVSDRTLRQMTVPRGTLKAVRVGRIIRNSPEAVQVWIKDQYFRTGSTA